MVTLTENVTHRINSRLILGVNLYALHLELTELTNLRLNFRLVRKERKPSISFRTISEWTLEVASNQLKISLSSFTASSSPRIWKYFLRNFKNLEFLRVISVSLLVKECAHYRCDLTQTAAMLYLLRLLMGLPLQPQLLTQYIHRQSFTTLLPTYSELILQANSLGITPLNSTGFLNLKKSKSFPSQSSLIKSDQSN